LIPVRFIKPFVKSNKNDYLAEAIAETVQRPTMKFVPVKSTEQLDLQASIGSPDFPGEPD